MSQESSNQPQSSTENHRAAISELLGGEPEVTASATPGQPEEVGGLAEQPPVTPEDTTPNTPPAEKPSIDLYQNLAEISEGLVKSEDDFKSIFQQAKKVTDLENQYESLAKERDALKNSNPYANEYVQKLNDLYQSGADATKINLFNRINQLGDLSQLSSNDAVKWQLMEKHSLTEQEAETKIRNTYKNDEDLYSEDEIAAANIDLKIQGDEAKTYLKGLQASFESKVAVAEEKETPEQIAQKTLQYETQLNPITKAIEQELPSYFSKINVNGKQGDAALTIDLPVPAEVQTSIAAQVKDYATNFQVDLSKAENVKGLKDYAVSLTKIAMFDAWMIDASNKREEAIRKEFHNPANINRGTDNPAAPAKTAREAVASKIASEF
jgi:vacuolar-type H+-ATPase subunit I/STV1